MQPGEVWPYETFGGDVYTSKWWRASHQPGLEYQTPKGGLMVGGFAAGFIFMLLGVVMGTAGGVTAGALFFMLGIAALVAGSIAFSTRENAKDNVRNGNIEAVAQRTPLNAVAEACTPAFDSNALLAAMSRRQGTALPLAVDAPGVHEHALFTAQRVKDAASPIFASPGMVKNSLVLTFEESDEDGGSTVEDYYNTLRYFEVEFTDANGQARHVWSDALLGDFGPGERVTVYWYLARSGTGRGYVRVHDMAGAAQPVDSARHAAKPVGFFLGLMAEPPERRNANGYWTAQQSLFESREALLSRFAMGGSYGAWAATQPWGVLYSLSAQAWYASDRVHWQWRASGGWPNRTLHSPCDFSGERNRPSYRSYPAVNQDYILNPNGEYSIHQSLRQHAVQGVVEDLVPVPLFNIRRHCGMGYIARVGINGTEHVWALCDPLRPDSYCGESPETARVPLRLGDSCMLWRGEGGIGSDRVSPLLCFVAPLA